MTIKGMANIMRLDITNAHTHLFVAALWWNAKARYWKRRAKRK